MKPRPLLLLLAAASSAFPLRAQLGDTLGEGPEVPLAAARNMTPAPVLSPEEEQRSFRLPPGFTIEPVAAEPMVHDPVAAAIDHEGNLWVAEFTQFNAGMIKDEPELAGGASYVPSSRVAKLVSTRRDGNFDRRIDWLDGLEHLRGVAVVHGGLLVADPPNLWLAREAHGTGRCDEKLLLAANYGVPSSDEDSGSLLWGRDNIIHDISFVYDYRYRDGAVERLPVLWRGQFGITQDDSGRLLFTRNSDQLRCDLFAPAYNVRNPDATSFPWANVNIAKDQIVWPSHPTPAVNRGYRPGVAGESTGGLRPDGTLLEFTAACSSMVYRGANFPSGMYGQVFVPEPSANLIHLDLLHEKDARILATDAYPHDEFLTSTDTRFRPVALLNCPDGSMLVIDMYRGLLEEYHMTTTYLKEQTLGRGLDKPMFGLGRIWRIRYTGGPLDSEWPDLDRRSGPELAALLEKPDSWWRESAQQELVERGGRDAVPALNRIALQGAASYARIAALWTLDGLEATTPDLLRRALRDPDSKVRRAAARLHERFLAASSAPGAELLEGLRPAIGDPTADVRIQLALTVGADPRPEAFPFMREILVRDGGDSFVAPALVTGLGGRELAFANFLLGDAATAADGRVLRILPMLSACVVHRADPGEVRELVALAGSEAVPVPDRLALIAGAGKYFESSFRRAMRTGAAVQSEEFAPLAKSGDPEIAAAGGRVYERLRGMEEEKRRRDAAARVLTPEEQKRYAAGQTTFQICSACHQPTGTGRPGVAPSLVDSRWILGNPEILVRIVLNGKEGTPGFAGGMPPIGAAFTNEQIADVLTYVRNSWSLHGGGVDPATVAKVRRVLGTRVAAWNDHDLERVDAELRRIEQSSSASHGQY